MGLNIRIHDINVPASFELFYKTGNTPGNMTVIENGYTKFGGTYPSSSSRNYNVDPIVFTGATFNTQYWFKIQYTGVTGNENSVGYIIENIKTHQPVGNIYYALHCCDFSGGTAEFYTGCTFSGGTVVYEQSLDPTATPPATPEPTPNPTASPTPTGTPGPTSGPTATPNATPNPTNTQTPTPTETLPGATPNPTSTSNPTSTPDATPIPTPTPTDEIQYTYLAGCSGGTLLGWIEGSYQGNLGVTINGTCYVTTYTTTNPTQGTLITGTKTWGSCCPTPDPTASLSLVAVGIYTGSTFGNSTAACNDTNYPNGTLYLPHGETLSNTDILYIDQTLFTQFTGNDQYYRLYYNNNFYAATISSMGYVSNLISCSSIPGPTPEPTNSPTPSVTTAAVAGNGCILITESSTYGLQDGCGGYQKTDNTVYFTLQDGNGNNITATENITISIAATYSDELGNTSTSVGTQINLGTSSGTSSYTPSTYEIGPYSGQCIPVSTTLDYNSITITGSNGGTYTVC